MSDFLKDLATLCLAIGNIGMLWVQYFRPPKDQRMIDLRKKFPNLKDMELEETAEKQIDCERSFFIPFALSGLILFALSFVLP